MRITSRAVRFVRLDLRASLRPRFVRLVPPGASLPRAAAAGAAPERLAGLPLGPPAALLPAELRRP